MAHLYIPLLLKKEDRCFKRLFYTSKFEALTLIWDTVKQDQSTSLNPRNDGVHWTASWVQSVWNPTGTDTGIFQGTALSLWIQGKKEGLAKDVSKKSLGSSSHGNSPASQFRHFLGKNTLQKSCQYRFQSLGGSAPYAFLSIKTCLAT